MWRSDRRACATLALIALASLAGIASVDAHAETPPQRYQHQPARRQSQGARWRAATRQRRPVHSARAEGAYTAAREGAARARAQPAFGYHRQMVGRNLEGRRPAAVGAMREVRPGGGGTIHEASPGLAAGQVHVVRYGNALSGTVERTIRPGLVSRTFVSGGHVLYAHVYRRQVWHRFGRAFAYDTFVPAVRYPAVYYGWALRAWARPVVYTWGWQVQPWYPMYGSLFTPYPVYTSPDLWMTDYIIAQSLQTAYQARTAVPASQPAPPAVPVPAAPAVSNAPAVPAVPAAPAPQPGDAPALQSTDASSAPLEIPPAVTPQIKAQLDAEIRVQLQERQAAAATPATLTTQSTPAALRPNHVFFQVVQPLDVAAATPGHYCSLSANDYIKRTGGMSSDDWMIPVVVELSGSSDCPEGLQTRIGLNDLNAMENEQEARVMEAMQAASGSLGSNGPPSGPGVHPTVIADGSAAPDPGALDAIRQTQ